MLGIFVLNFSNITIRGLEIRQRDVLRMGVMPPVFGSQKITFFDFKTLGSD